MTTVTVTVTLWPIVAVPVGETVTPLMLGTPNNITVTTKLLDNPPPDAVTLIVYVVGTVEEALETMVRTRVAVEPGVTLTVTLVAVAVEFVNSAEGPFVRAGETDAVRTMMPFKPTLFNVTLDLANSPTMKLAGRTGV